jgi:hypothetical protein
VPNGDPDALAAAIIDLAKDLDRRRGYAANASLFYNKHLSSSIALEQIVSRLALNPAKDS